MKRFVFTGKQEVAFESFELAEPGPGAVRIRALVSLMSTGTENIVFNRLFEPGSHWDRWVKYPFYPGYATVGKVEALGNGVTQVKVGDVVATRTAHASHANVSENDCHPVPEGMDLQAAAWFAFAKIAFMGTKAAEYQLGDTALLIGAGPIGQMAIRWANALGLASIAVADTIRYRLELAGKGGATALIETPIAPDSKIPASRVVVDCTGNAKVFASALALVQARGKVVLLGDTGSPTAQHLTADVITRGITIIGAHDVHETPEWNGKIIIRYFFNLASSGRFDLAGLTSHVFDPAECVKAYRLANEARESTMGIVFDWTKV